VCVCSGSRDHAEEGDLTKELSVLHSSSGLGLERLAWAVPMLSGPAWSFPSLGPGAGAGTAGYWARLLLSQIVLLQELRPEILGRRVIVRPTLWSEVHEIPVRPHRVDVIRHRLGSPEMKNASVLFPEDMHHGPLHIARRPLAPVIGLIGGAESRNQRDLRPATYPSPLVDSRGWCLRNGDEGGVP